MAQNEAPGTTTQTWGQPGQSNIPYGESRRYASPGEAQPQGPQRFGQEGMGSRVGIYSAIAAGSIGALAFLLMNREKAQEVIEEGVGRFTQRARGLGRETGEGRDTSTIQARDIMTQSPAVVTGDTDLKKVAQLMAECDCGAIPVVESKTNRRPIGVITDRDIVIRTIAEGKDPMDCTARDCMTEDVISVRPEATVDQVIEKMENNQVRRVLVVDRNGKCQGIISQGDIARYAPKREAGELVREVSKPSGILARSR